MFPRYIELTNYLYRIQQEINSGASAKVFLAKRRPLSNKEFIIPIPTAKTDFSFNYPDKNEIAPHQLQIRPHEPKINEESLKQEKFKQQIPQNKQIVQDSIKNKQYLTQTTSFNKQKNEELWTGEPCALKIMCIQHRNYNEKIKREFQIQLKMLKQLKHPGIVSLIDHGILQDQRKVELFLALEWGVGGNFSRLIDLVYERSHYYSQKEEIFRYYAAQLIEIIGYLQSKGISHRDIKAQNLILDKYYRLRLIDFGAAQIFDQERSKFKFNLPSQKDLQKQAEMKVYVGSKHYISPEMIQRSRYSKDIQHYSKTDIWSIGVVLYYMFTRKYPFDGSNTYYIIDQIKIKEVDYQGISDPLLVPLLRMIFQKSPELRADINQLKSHEYFKDVDFKKIFQSQSPIIKIIKSNSEQYFYLGQAVVKIFGTTQFRVIGIFRRSSIMKNKNLQLFSRRGSIFEPHFNKNQSEVTQVNSDKYICSQQYLQAFQRKITFKYYLSIAKKQANSIPKHLQIDKNTRLQVTKLSCLLHGVKFINKPELQPDTVQLRFNMEQELDKFVTAFRDVFRSE